MATVATDSMGAEFHKNLGKNVVVAPPEERILDRVYNFPEDLPEKAMDILVDIAVDDDVTNKEMDYIYFVVVTLPMMATSGMFSDQKTRYLKESRCGFQDYIRLRINKVNQMSVDGYNKKFCERIRQLLWRFTLI